MAISDRLVPWACAAAIVIDEKNPILKLAMMLNKLNTSAPAANACVPSCAKSHVRNIPLTAIPPFCTKRGSVLKIIERNSFRNNIKRGDEVNMVKSILKTYSWSQCIDSNLLLFEAVT